MKAIASFKSSQMEANAVADTIVIKGGIDMALEFIKLDVEGMSCSHCENAVKKAVGALTGVDKVDVSLQENTVSVEFDPGKVTVIQIKEAIDDQGYEVK